MSRLVTSLFLIAALTVVAQTPVRGTIKGKIVDKLNQPVAGVTVGLNPLGVIINGMLPSTTTDADGNFQFRNLGLGGYAVSYSMEGQSYPNTFWALYSYSVGVRRVITLTEQEPSAEITLPLGPKAGVMTGQILDAVTGDPIKTASFRIWRTAKSRIAMGTSTRTPYTALLPAGIEVKLLFHAPGYEDWYYPGVARESDATPITLKSGDTLNVDVRMVPSVAPNTKNQPSRPTPQQRETLPN
jgi:Carboxypeptidase regulatory-like domain